VRAYCRNAPMSSSSLPVSLRTSPSDSRGALPRSWWLGKAGLRRTPRNRPRRHSSTGGTIGWSSFCDDVGSERSKSTVRVSASRYCQVVGACDCLPGSSPVARSIEKKLGALEPPNTRPRPLGAGQRGTHDTKGPRATYEDPMHEKRQEGGEKKRATAPNNSAKEEPCRRATQRKLPTNEQ
jgi:hypothetical protein